MSDYATMDFFFAKLFVWLVLGVFVLMAAARQKDWLWNGLPIPIALSAIALWPATVLLLLFARAQVWYEFFSKEGE
jgi:hypothetical protein